MYKQAQEVAVILLNILKIPRQIIAAPKAELPREPTYMLAVPLINPMQILLLAVLQQERGIHLVIASVARTQIISLPLSHVV
jgi:hypothetical protein